MVSDVKSSFLGELTNRLGKLQRINNSLSLFKTVEGDIRIYIRYSKIHSGERTWYGLRDIDLHELEGHNSLIGFLWDDQSEPLLVPYSEYEDLFQSLKPAEDGQYKVQVIIKDDGTELYVARAGRFNVEGYLGWEQLEKIIDIKSSRKIPNLSHSQIQTLLGSIGSFKNYDVWIPTIDRIKLDWVITRQFSCKDNLPLGYEQIENILHEIDVIWLQKGANDIKALFEVEHSTPIYSGLLRFNDILLAIPGLRPRFSIVANEERRSHFMRQLNRPTFHESGLGDVCTFFEYGDVYNWHQKILGG
jgi:hypothetical protein